MLAFVDDDVAVDPAWLHNLTASLHNSEWAGVGGRTLPTRGFSFPPWFLPDSAGILCAYFDLGDAPCEIFQAPYGANMAFRKEMFEKYGGFRTDMGPSPDQDIPRPNEDTEFGRRLMAAGERLRYEPLALVRHPTLQDRLNKNYFLKWWFDHGRASVREYDGKPDILGIPRRYLSLIKHGTVLMLVNVLRWQVTLNSQMRFYRKCWAWMTAGATAKLYRSSFSVKKSGPIVNGAS